ncbi:MAG TPA: SprT family zinc-dependent metalloprotease [Syntrophorhabdaceae bacterium]|nr:SprT family zinc-dependent metalloprotease [Syntrophorhabdaceae bacterium]
MEDMDYRVVRSRNRRRTLVLQIERDGSIVMRVPYHATQSEISSFFNQKLPWLRRKVAEHKEANKLPEALRQFVKGELFPYLGENYPLEIGNSNGSKNKLTLSHGAFLLDSSHVKGARDLFVQWYKRMAAEIFAERVRFYSRKLSLYPVDVRISSARTRYGSCTADNKLFFSFRLVMAPYSKIDYVIVHELAHIKIKDHSHRFWKYMEQVMPDYKKHRIWLRENSAFLDI